jgi:hypothetical protein
MQKEEDVKKLLCCTIRGLKGAWHIGSLGQCSFNASYRNGPLLESSKKGEHFVMRCWVAIAFSGEMLMTATAGFLSKYHQEKMYKKEFLQFLGVGTTCSV